MKTKKPVGKPRHGKEVKTRTGISIDPKLKAMAIKKFGNLSKAIDIALREILHWDS